MILHTIFDLLAALGSMAMTFICYRWRLSDAAGRIESFGMAYGLALVLGSVAGGYGAGTLNLWLSGAPGIGRSIVGALAASSWVRRVHIFG